MKKILNIFSIVFFLAFLILPKVSLATVALSIANTSPTSNVSTLTSTSVTLNATGLTSQAPVIITVDNNPTSATTPLYHFSSSGAQASFAGVASSNFFALTEGGMYTAKVVYLSTPANVLATIDFTTKSYVITSFDFNSLNPAESGSINNHTIYVSVPAGTDVTALVPTIEVTSGATVTPASLMPQDFSNPVVYTLIGDAGSHNSYLVEVTVEDNSSNVKIDNITPMAGKIGDMVTITGQSFGSVTKILFNETETTNFTLNNGEATIVVNVPDGATTGKIILKTLSNVDVESTSNFSINGSGGGATCSDGIKNQDETGIDTGGVCSSTKTDLSNNADGLVAKCGPDGCGFSDLLVMINKVIDFIFKYMVLPIAAIMFAYAGFMLVVSAGASEKRTKAKNVFINVAIGLVIAAAAWLIVSTILSIVGHNTTINWFGL
ncbi:MAG: hypothetical protein WCI93_01515 [bacterium]